MSNEDWEWAERGISPHDTKTKRKSKMIEGIKVTIDGNELKELCESRAAHHRERAATYEQQASNMKEAQIEGMNYTNGNPINTLEDKQHRHANEADELKFIADHVALEETYLLDTNDLNKLGITRSRY